MTIDPQWAKAEATSMVTNWITGLASFPQILSENLGVFAIGLILVGGLLYFTQQFPPVFPQSVRSTPSSKKGNGVEGGAAVAIGLYVTWQYVVHGDIWIGLAKYLLVLAFFGQVYSLITKLQAHHTVSGTQTAWGIAKTILGIASVTSVMVVLDKAQSYWSSIDASITSLNFFDFAKFYFHVFGKYTDWCLFAMQQGFGILTRILVIIVSLKVFAYHVSVRFPHFCQNHPKLVRHFAGADSMVTSIFVFVVSFMADDMMKGRLFADAQAFFGQLVKILFFA